MSITDELRSWVARRLAGWKMLREEHDELTAIADRIDAEHERRMVERADRYSELRNKMNNCYIELPKDADGVPWSVGDRDEDGNVVTQLRLSSDGWYAITDGLSAFHPEQRRHYHAPTVEDVLREFANEVYADADNEIRDRDFLCAKYAKRLTLAEVEDA